MHVAAGEGNGPHTCFGNEDYYNGLLSAVAILLSLVHRERTGRGRVVETPQLHSSVLATSEHFVHDGRVVPGFGVLDHEQMGWSEGFRAYQCLEGWLAVACATDAELAALRATVLGPDDTEVEYALFGRSATEWVEVLRAAGVPCEVIREDAFLKPFLLDDANVAAGLSVEYEHPVHGRARVIGEIVHLHRTSSRPRRRSPLLGEDSVGVLLELGLDPAVVDDLVGRGVVVVTPVPAPVGG
jgi:crotonobetainyl-CoA:carnitine CoA-transferase CaiB-like acyl-CoA transferase